MSTTASERTRRSTIVGAVLAALVASSCCIGPLVLAALGLGGAGAFAVLGAYRPYILSVTALLLSLGFCLTYRKPRPLAADVCGCERPKAGRAARIGLWTATGMTIALAAAPVLLGMGLAGRSEGTVVASDTKTQSAVILVEGMDCEACAAHLKTALRKVGGFRDLTLDLPNRKITVTYEPAPGRPDAYVAAINEIGYTAKAGPFQ